MKTHKTVLMPIEVTVGDYCRGRNRVCGNFSDEENYPHCRLEFFPLKADKEGRILKPITCKNLKNG